MDDQIILYEGKDGTMIKEISAEDGHTGGIISFAYLIFTHDLAYCV